VEEGVDVEARGVFQGGGSRDFRGHLDRGRKGVATEWGWICSEMES
jgi:hypothetical protein